METSDYLTVIAYSIGAFVVLSLPFIVAAIATVSKSYDIPRKKLFVFSSGVFSYGLSGILAIILGPVKVLSTFIAPRLHLDGYSFIGSSLQGLSNILEIIVPLFAIIVMFAVPLYARKGLWQTFCEALANQTLKRTE